MLLASGEIHLLEKYLRNASSFFEFGTGASTVYLAMRFPKLHMHSVEMDGSWVSASAPKRRLF